MFNKFLIFLLAPFGKLSLSLQAEHITTISFTQYRMNTTTTLSAPIMFYTTYEPAPANYVSWTYSFNY